MKNVRKSLKRRYLKLRLTATLLTVVLLYLACPFSAVAVVETEQTIEMQQEENETTDVLVESVGEDYFSEDMTGGISELISLREENVKHFKMTDGTYRAVTYANEVHRKDTEGVWQDIDNRLIEKRENNVGLYVSSDERVSFVSKFIFGQPIFSLSENGKTVSLSMISNQLSAEDDVTLREIAPTETDILATVVNAEQRADANRWETFEEAVKVNTNTGVRYANVKKNTDLEYVLDGNDIKENIIVKEKGTNYVYRFFLETKGLVATLQDNGGITLLDPKSEEVYYVIPAPYMYDAVEAFSDSVTYTLTAKKNGYELTVIADAEWINAEERSFPVTIDPTILTTSNGLQDTFIQSSASNSNRASYINLWAGVDRIAFVKFNLPELPVGAELYYAMINLAYFHQYTSDSITIGAFQILENFDYNTVTWNIAHAYTNNGISTNQLGSDILMVSSQITASTPGDAQFEITDAVSAWYEDPTTNYGIALTRVAGTIPYVMFRAKEAGDGKQAYMTVAYTMEIADGVYAIKNFAYPTRWMTVEGGNTASGYHIQQKASNVPPATASLFDRSSLFKISRYRDGVHYIIRSMVNNRLSPVLSGAEVITREIPPEDANVQPSATFRIEWSGYGFLISPYGQTRCITMSFTSVANLTVVNKDGAIPATLWNFDQYSGAHRQGSVLYFSPSWRSTGLVVGDTYTASLIGWSTRIDGNKLLLEVNPSHSDLGSSTWNSSTNQITLTAKEPGELSLRVQLKYSTGNAFYTGFYNYQIVPKQGTYYIQNAGTERYIDVEGPSTLSGAVIQQWEFHTGNQEKWIVEHVEDSNGYVRLKSVYSNLYMGVDSSNTSSVKQYNTQNDYTLWRIDRSSTGNLILLCKATSKALSTPLTSNGLGTDLTQFTYVDDANYTDEWILYEIKYSYYADHHYDQGFSVRFANINSNSANLINSYQNIVAERFLRIFDVQVISNYTSYTSSADLCKIQTFGSITYTNCGVACDHSPTHLTSTVLRDDLPNGSAITSVVIWTGHLLNDNARSNSDSTRYSIVITPWKTSTLSDASDIERETVFSLAHEQSHQLGAPDHYCYGIGSSGKCSNAYCDICVNGRNSARSCFMSYRYDLSTLTDQNMYCSDCKTTISNHVNNHH